MTRRAQGGIDKLPSGRWRARYTAPDGTKRSLGTFATKKEADTALARVTVDVAAGVWRPPTKGETLRGYMEKWLDGVAIKKDSRTTKYYEGAARNYVLAPLQLGKQTVCLADVPIGKLTPAMCSDWHTAVVATAAKRRREQLEQAGKPVPPNAGEAAAVSAARALQCCLNQAVKDELIAKNPFKVERATQLTSPERKPATPAEVAAAYAAIPDRYKALVLVWAWGALRRGEGLGLRRRDVTIWRDDSGEITGAVLQVEQQVVAGEKSRMRVKEPKTKKSRRAVTVPAKVAAVLDEHLSKFTGPDQDDLVFTAKGGGMVNAANFRARYWVPAREAAGRPDLRIQDLRHTGLTEAGRTGASLDALMKRAGHTQVQTATRYQHADMLDDQRIAATLNNVVANVL